MSERADATQTSHRVQAEIERLHAFLVGWFTGAGYEQDVAEVAFQEEFLDRFHPDLVLIPPSGETLSVDQFAAVTKAAYASNPEFGVAIRNVRVLQCCEEAQIAASGSGSLIVATYEEWQRNALASEPADNGRAATVVFENVEPLRWLHIHETWLPSAVMEAASYDF